MKKTILALLLAAPLFAQAEDTFKLPTVTVSGFGTLAATRANTDDAQFARPNQASGAGKSFRTGVDSNLGLQGNASINSWLSATMQGLVRKDGADDFGADLTLAFLKAQVNDNLSIRVGRTALPAFLISDYRNVGFANHMVRPPAEVYNLMPLNSIDGVDATWQQSFKDTTVSAQITVGSSKADISSSGGTLHVKATDIAGITLIAEHGPVTARVGRVWGKLTVNDSVAVNTLLNGLRAAGTGYKFASLAPLADNLALDHKAGVFTSAGLTMDWNNVVVQAEYAKREIPSYLNDSASWSVMTGYRIGKFLPYFNHAEIKTLGRVANTVPNSCPAGYPAACTPTLGALSTGVDYMTAPITQSTDTLGVRWDFHKSMALKAQIDRVRPTGNAGLLLRAAPGFTGPVTVGAIALDFVF